MLTLITGPVRSGKSERAEALARERALPVTVLATAAVDPADGEMEDRVARHRRDRPAEWRVIETSLDGGDTLATALARVPAGSCVIVDALGTWLAARMLPLELEIEADAVTALDRLDALARDVVVALRSCAADVIVVAEAVGWDVVPPSAQGRVFRDALGRATRALAAHAQRVELVVAGIPLTLRDDASGTSSA